MSVDQNLRFPLRNRGVPQGDRPAARRGNPRVLEISHLLNAGPGPVRRCQQLVSLGRALVRQDVAAMLFDEPLTVVDPPLKWRCARCSSGSTALNHTLVYVTHDQTEALTFADEVVVMNDGRGGAEGHARRAVRAARAHVRRPLHRLAGHELHACTVHDGVVGVGGVDLLRLPDARSPPSATGDIVGCGPNSSAAAPSRTGRARPPSPESAIWAPCTSSTCGVDDARRPRPVRRRPDRAP